MSADGSLWGLPLRAGGGASRRSLGSSASDPVAQSVEVRGRHRLSERQGKALSPSVRAQLSTSKVRFAISLF
jgi:hypothetical protein